MTGDFAYSRDEQEPRSTSNDGRHIAVGGFGFVEIWSSTGTFERIVNVPGVPFMPGRLVWATNDRAVLLTDRWSWEAHKDTDVVVPLEDISGDAAGLRFRGTGGDEPPRQASIVLARSSRAVAELAPARVLENWTSANYLTPAILRLRSSGSCVEIGGATPQTRVFFTADGAHLVVVDRFVVTVRDAETGRAVTAWRGATIAADAEHAFALIDGGIRAADLRRGTLGPFTLPRQIIDEWESLGAYPGVANRYRPGGVDGDILVSRDRSFVIAESQRGSQVIAIRYLSGPEPLRTFHIDRVIERIALSPEDRRFAVGSSDGHVQIRDRSSGSLIGQLDLPTGIRALAFSPDGRQIAVSARDGEVRVHDIETNSVVGSVHLQANHALLLTWADASTLIIDTLRGQTVTARMLRGAP